ncbi:FAR-17a/AIG1-like protein [Purpureocillium lavendulum]|uniref:FAR-17a/AIG1-like protein n=1 Tax=Purpureocillium lavendulum TaxID=1247861 RepID=A0AB34G4K0_9HYPO|nr:FAR-17a/AIG1-like protein [Purpureocillium lavendulum]
MARHRLQRLASPSPSISLLLHAAGIASFCYSFYFLTTWPTPFDEAYGWHFQFLTIIGLAVSLLCFVSGAVADVTGSRALFDVKNALAVLAAPLEVVISLLYWGISAVDPELLVDGDFALPLAADVGFHLAPAVFLTLDLVLLSPPWTVPAYGVMSLSTVFAFGYWYWVELCFSKNGWYPYPLFGLLSTAQRALLFVTSAALVTLSSGALKSVYGSVNGYDKARREPHKPLKKLQ